MVYNMLVLLRFVWMFSPNCDKMCKKCLTLYILPTIMIIQISRYGESIDDIIFFYWRELTVMKSTGIIRKVDDLGRIVLPIELRRALDIAERDELEIYMESDRIILQKFEPACVFCGSSRALVSYRRKNVCQECIKKMADY